jgi:hypothetical protein
MTLGDFEIIPGVVISNDDPLNQGRVRACAPGLFDTSTMDIDDLFWINPFMMMGHQTFSKLEINSKVWILHNVNNYFEYWYIPMFEISENAPTIHQENADVMMSRSIGGNKVQLYYSPENGYNIVVGENRLQLSSSGDFNVVAQDAVITANSDGIKLSKYNGETFSATKAEPLITALNGFCSDLQSLCVATVANPWTAPMAIPLCEAVVKFQNQLQNIKSDFVKIS